MDQRAAGKEQNRLGLALQGMALWHLLLGVPLLIILFFLLTAGDDSASEGHGRGMTILATGALGGGSTFAGLVFGGISWAILGRRFWRPRWSTIMVPGLVGTLTSAFTAFIGWPLSELIGIWVASGLVNRQLRKGPPAAGDTIGA
jgi:hypothetical protein